MTARRWPLLASLVVVGALLVPLGVRADVPPDVLDSYMIAVTPQPDGMLVIDYRLTGYHAMSDWPSNEPYLQIGVPNANFSIVNASSGGTADVSKVEPVNRGGWFVQFDFRTLPRNGDVFSLHFTISQGEMANRDTSHDQITYQFIPAGWTFPISVDELTVSWAQPANLALLKSAQPAPTFAGTAMTWHWSHPPLSSGMFRGSTIALAYDASAFTLSDAATARGGFDGGVLGGAVLAVFWFCVVGAFLYVAFLSHDGYRGGAGLRAGMSGGRRVGGRIGGGHIGGCACAGCACACACACAGGGKVGCSRKAIGIACLPGVLHARTADSTRSA